MQPVEVRPSIFWVGMNDRHIELFEGLWSIRDEGVSYNSYLIRDKKNVIIDLSSKLNADELFDQIRTIIDPSSLDYVVINHMEPDHSGSLRSLIMLAPNVVILGSAKTKEMLSTFYGITENVRAVADGEELDLGEHKLKFFSTPFIHWPETMMTYEMSSKVLFSCDGFGGFGALNGTIFDDPNVPVAWYEEQAMRYFVNIVSSFSKPVRNAIAKLQTVPIEVIAPSHGLIWRKNPTRIISLYQQWASYAGVAGDPGVTLLFASMYGNTEKIMEVIAQGVVDEGLPISIFNVSETPITYILPSLWVKRGVLIGAPTYEGGLFPDMSNALDMAKQKHIFSKLAAGFGSYAWMGGGQRDLNERIQALRWDNLGNFEFTGRPDSRELDEGRKFGAEFARKILAK